MPRPPLDRLRGAGIDRPDWADTDPRLWAGIDLLLWAGIGLGVASRLRRFLDARSLWGDEAMMALNVLERGFSGLLAPLDHAQAAAPGFLWLEKAATLVLGEGELALRLWPLLAGLLSLVVFHRVARMLLPPRGALLALLLLSIAEPQVYYAAEVKPYSTDVLVGLLLLRAALLVEQRGLEVRGAVGLALLGAIAPWLSNAAALVAAGLGTVLFASALRALKWRSMCRLAAVGACWAASFAALYALLLGEARDSAYLATFWASGMPPGLADPGPLLGWYARTFPGFFNDPLGLPTAAVAAPALLFGAMALGAESARRLVLVLAPIAAALAAAHAGVYPFATSATPDVTLGAAPFTGRLILFTAPSAFLLIARGLLLCSQLAGPRHAVLGAVPSFLLLAVPLGLQLRNTLDPPRLQELRPVVAELAVQQRAGDVVYLQSFSDPVFAYYQRRFGLEDLDTRSITGNAGGLGRLQQELRQLPSGGRVWHVALHHPNWLSDVEEQRIRRVLERACVGGAPIVALRARATPYTTRPRARAQPDP